MVLRMTKTRLVWVLGAGLGLAVLGCSDDGKGEGEGSESSGSTESSSSAETGTASGDGDGDPATGDGDGDPATGDGDGDGDPSGDGDGDPNAECGNGVVEAGEECDDGDENGEGFACLDDCTFNVCGDGIIGPEEGCDDGNLDNGDGCSDTCLIEDPDEGTIPCGNKIYACGDAIDNDMDGLVDLDDPECISPCDDDEGTFKTNLPGQNNDCKGDCYFDDNSGSGDDKCEWNLQCDPENPGAEIGCEYDPNFGMCQDMQVETCKDICTPLVPNGCDCFGCCEIDGQFVYLDGAECSLDNLDGCQSCTFFEDCNNPCEPELCELCFGQDPEDLPEDCEETSCPDDVTPCANISDCEVGYFCQTGCCVPIEAQ